MGGPGARAALVAVLAVVVGALTNLATSAFDVQAWRWSLVAGVVVTGLVVAFLEYVRNKPARRPEPPGAYSWLPQRCPVCGAPLNMVPRSDENSGRYHEPPVLTLEIGPLSWKTNWRLTVFGGGHPPWLSEEPPFSADLVEEIYRVCGGGHVFLVGRTERAPHARVQIEERVDRWVSVATLGSVAAGKSCVVQRLLAQPLVDSGAWGDRPANAIRREAIGSLEHKILHERAECYGEMVEGGRPINPTGVSANEYMALTDLLHDQTPIDILADLLVGGSQTVRRWWGSVRQPYVLRVSDHLRRTWTGMVDLPGEYLHADGTSSLEIKRLREYDAIMWSVDPMLHPEVRRMLDAQVAEASARPGTLDRVGMDRGSGYRLEMQSSIAQRIAYFYGPANGERMPRLYVAITKCDLLHGLLAAGHGLADLGDGDLVPAAAEGYLAVVLSRVEGEQLKPDQACRRFLRAIRRRREEAARSILEHYSSPGAFWNLLDTGDEDRVEALGLVVPSLDDHLAGVSQDGPPLLGLRDLVMGVVGFGLVHGLNPGPWLNALLRESGRDLPMVFLTSALATAPTMEADGERIKPVAREAHFARPSETSAGITQLLAAILTTRDRPETAPARSA